MRRIWIFWAFLFGMAIGIALCDYVHRYRSALRIIER